MRRAVTRPTYHCRECGHTPAKWEGRCSRCEAWNSIEERAVPAPAFPSRIPAAASPLIDAPVELASLPVSATTRIPTGLSELDRVLGGGLVPGATALLAGDPGIGKSTLLLQAAAAVAASGGKVLYATGEESLDQVRSRATRLGISGANLYLVATGDVSELVAQIETLRPLVTVVDSVQTSSVAGSESAPGTLAQVRDSAAALSACARDRQTALVLAGHVTKDGAIAGPRVLEHMVDIVLQMDGEPGGALRLLRAAKNRLGSTEELGVFEMRADGLSPVDDPSAVFLAHRQAGTPGSAVATLIEGTRPITVEVQALVTPSASSAPRRVVNGLDISRVLLISAVISKRLRLPTGTSDIVLNVAGGLRARETGVDLAVALAIVSSILDRPVSASMAAAGEVGLGGELRSVPQPARRVAEARRLGYTSCLLPANSADQGADRAHTPAAEGAQHAATLVEAVRAAIPVPET
jgi:DNA repair protein RadA/Sms